MPHQCVRCGSLYDDGAQEILQGCSKCGKKVFFYIKKERLAHLKESTTKLTKKERGQIEKDILELVGVDADSKEPVVLDLESIRILKPGQYELDLVNLFRKRPLVYKLEEGKYVIDLPQTFKKNDE